MVKSISRLITIMFACLMMYNTFAEGPLSSTGTDPYGGPYRRVRSVIGYKGIKCSYSIPVLTLPGDMSKNSEELAHRSSPGFYVGVGSSETEVDTGVTYEYIQKGDGVPDVAAGWCIFMRVSGGPLVKWGTNPPGGWRSNPSENPNVTDFNLVCAVNSDRSVYLSTDAVGADTQPGTIATENPAFSTTTGIYAKRITQIAQSQYNPFPEAKHLSTYIEDGTLMVGCIANSIYLTTVLSPGDNDWQAWSSTTQVDQDNTGYSPGGTYNYQCKDMHVTTTRNAAGAKYIVDFPYFSTNQRDSIFVNRYQSEEIDIWLRAAITVKGSRIAPSGNW